MEQWDASESSLSLHTAYSLTPVASASDDPSFSDDRSRRSPAPLLPRLAASPTPHRDNVAREGYQHRRSDSLTGSTIGTPRQRQDSGSGSGTFTPFSTTDDRPHTPYRDSIDSLDEPTRRPTAPFRPRTGSSSNKSSYQSSLLGLTRLGVRPTSSSSEGHMRMESVGERATLVDPDDLLVHEGKPILDDDEAAYAVRAEDVESGRAFDDAPVRGPSAGPHEADYPIPSLVSQDPPAPGPLQRQLERLINPIRRRKAVARIERFIDGPKPARQLVIRPWFPRSEALLFRLCRPLSYPRFPLLTIVFLVGWILGNIFLTRASWYTSSTNFGTPDVLGCTDALWAQNADCGLNGTACAPFSDHFFPFRCPAGCASVQVLNTRTVGDLGVIYTPLVVGGGNFTDPETSAGTNATYRADSFICQAALHAGLFSDDRGGCGVVTQVGAGRDYTTSDRNGIKGIFYEGSFVSSYQFWAGVEQSGCRDLRWEILTFNVVMSFVFSLVLRPFPLLFFWVLCCAGFWVVTLATDPAAYPPISSFAFGTFLPFLFVCYGLWRSAWRFVLPAFSRAAVAERTVLYLGPWWVGVLFNLTLERLPLQRLTASDIRQQPGGLATVIVGGTVIGLLILQQVWFIRRAGILIRYLCWYGLGAICVCLFLAIPGFDFRFHHYFAALVLTPGTAILTRPSAIFQGFLLGMFTDGAARWGLESILQTPAELIGDGATGSPLPAFATNSTNFESTAVPSQLVAFEAIPANLTTTYNQFSLLVDDVLLCQGRDAQWSFAGLDRTVVHYFRLAYSQDGAAGDFTQAAVWFPNNSTWYDPLPGPS